MAFILYNYINLAIFGAKMLEIKNLNHGFGDKTLYKDVNLKINNGDKIGLVGENGAGKSTLVNILSGKILCDDGELVWDKKCKVGYLDQFAEIDTNLTVEQYLKTAFSDLYELEKKYNEINNLLATTADKKEMQLLMNKSGSILEELCARDFYSIDSQIIKISTGLGVSKFGMDTKVGSLSGGQRVKLMLVKLLLEKPDLLILDEPTNFLDTIHIEWLTKFLQEYTGCFLIVSHDIPFLNSVVNKIWAVDLKTIVPYSGNYQHYLQVRDERITQHNKLVVKQKQEEEKLKDYIARNGVRASTAKQAKSRQKVLDKLQKNMSDEIKESNPPEICFRYKNIDNAIMLVVKNLVIGYSKPLVSGINIKLLNGEKIRISGFNGVGKTTLFKTILSQIPSLSGTININKNVVFGYYEQNHIFSNNDNTAIQEVLHNYPKMTEKEVRSALAKSGLSSKKQMQPLSELSGGEQCKVQLCIITMAPCNLLLLDEPTNHLDVKSKQALAYSINKFPGGVLFVSHENDFANLINDCKEINLSKCRD